MAIPPNMRRFLVIANWPRVTVDTVEHRQNVRALILPGEETADPQLRAIWDASNLDAHVKMFNRDRMIYGRAFMSVGDQRARRGPPAGAGGVAARDDGPGRRAPRGDDRRRAVLRLR